MHRHLHFHPRPLVILLAIVLCLIATSALAQRRVSSVPSAPAAGAATTTATPATGAPAASGLTSGAAPGLTSGMPSASGLTSGSTALPAGSPAASGLTSGGTVTTPGTSTLPLGDTAATTTGGSTRGVVVLPADPNAQAAAANGVAPGALGVTGATPSVAAMRVVQGGPLSATQVALLFSQADADGDGQLTRAEALRLQVVTMSFDDMDTNRDGTVSRSEYESSLR